MIEDLKLTVQPLLATTTSTKYSSDMAECECIDGAFSDEVNEEVQALQAIYSGDGEFSIKQFGCPDDCGKSSYLCDINISPRDMRVALCFSLPASYPDTSPRIEIISPSETMSDDNVSRLLVHLYHVAHENTGSALIFSLVESARIWIQEHQVAVTEAVLEVDTEIADSSNKTAYMQPSCGDDPKKVGEKHDQKSCGPSKKPMKTATDVISRIQWDDQLNVDHFIVGYLDRFIGIVEQPFTAFYWDDISAVDHHTLAIPRHRIQYFKYKDEVVWDKRRRLDNVFGSQGSGVSITDVLERYTKENASEEEGTSEKEWDDMEDPEIDNGNDNREKECTTAAENLACKPRIKKSRPNYFLAIRITDDDVKTHVKHIQDYMTDLDPYITPYLTSEAHLHITLCMLQLNSESQISNALSVLKSIQHELMSLLLPVTLLRFQGVDTFHDRIVYIQPETNPALKQLSKCIQNSLLKAGINLTGTREEFVPHLTIMKMPRQEVNLHPIFTADLRSKYLDMLFGFQVVDAIHLCSLENRPAHDNFYYSLAKIDLLE